MVELTRELGLSLTLRQADLLESQWQQQQQQQHWHGQLPVLVLNRCWLRLAVVPLETLTTVLPPDSTAAAPELVRFRTLRQQGVESVLAESLCWQEFGQQACQQALQRYWQAQDDGRHGWTLADYLAFLATYRGLFERPGDRPLPLLVLARGRPRESHQLHWMAGRGNA
ncbi:hypothetical protein KQ302_05800 [Synechococcus sp. CS-602]|uniref:hypothetical protein n=1 Tax=Synechococcaceae TaxID=1890426 RepID=UPI0008FF5648|nr:MULTISPECIES: hypothetical protein [Synechococcaceae]MCT4364181.1 hypothetical protein [Candidatus Regnicoccus frigidus MAG-AL1]APD48988.1 hypothetical protein BM449_13000 [Synechococcus sp. SynAce01]MCT0201129.1 hypothetical protein [Synechococcus sp. CS-603]MCT0204622.1 hypothetical protein [Synechococcus sp. CS-602]MCT0245898.1 hypothetical protein [Synechococcus sp. CS-601]